MYVYICICCVLLLLLVICGYIEQYHKSLVWITLNESYLVNNFNCWIIKIFYLAHLSCQVSSCDSSQLYFSFSLNEIHLWLLFNEHFNLQVFLHFIPFVFFFFLIIVFLHFDSFNHHFLFHAKWFLFTNEEWSEKY